MRVLSLGIGFLVVLLCGGLLANPIAAADYALLVGIDDYEPAGDSALDLSSCETDALLMRNILVHKYGFAEGNIRVLLSLEATAKNIVSAFKEQLIDKAKPDDAVVFFYSGHGTQVLDTNGDEADGKDEALCPVDCRITGGMLTDDELGFMLGLLKTKHVSFISDSCHAGTVRRGPEELAKLRPKSILYEKEFRPTPEVGRAFPEYEQYRAAPAEGTTRLPLDQTGPVVLLAGCQSWESSSSFGMTVDLDGEEHRASLMTGYLYRVLSQARGEATWREICQALQLDMASACQYKQHPLLEGPGGEVAFRAGEAGAVVRRIPWPADHIRVLTYDAQLASGELSDLPFVKAVADEAAADVVVKPFGDNGGFVLLGPDTSGGFVYVEPPQSLEAALLALHQSRRTQMLTNPFAGFTVSLGISPDEVPAIQLGKPVALEFKSSADAYVTIVTLAPNGTAPAALVDHAVQANQAYAVPSKGLPRVAFGSRSRRKSESWQGTGVVKLIATSRPLGVDPKGCSDEPGNTVLDAVIAALAQQTADGERPGVLRCEGWADATTYYEVLVP